MKKLCFIFGTRPEIIKLSPLIRLCMQKKSDFFMIHTSQHYSQEMDKVFFDELKLPSPKYNLGIKSCYHGEMVGQMLIAIEKILLDENPDIVFVQGDTNSVLAGAIAVSKLNINLAHVEAGLRSYDRLMPEEINRIVADRLSDYLFCPTEIQREILLKEGIEENKIYVVGNTIVDAVYENITIAEKSVNKGYQDKKYLLLTLHRPSNVDDAKVFKDIIKGLKYIYDYTGLDIIYPVHPRTKKNINKFNITLFKGLKLIEPQPYLAFLLLQKNARVMLTDSGGIQEEACILGVPCVTIRNNTERPETIKVGSNIIAGTSPNGIFSAYKKMVDVNQNWKNPLGDGKTSRRILEIIGSS